MIDKDEVERGALVANNLRYWLCEFHAMKALKPRIKKFDTNIASSVICHHKMIARSTDENSLSHNIQEMKR